MHKLWLLRSTNSTLFGNFYLSSGQKIMWLHKIRQSVRSTNYLYFALLSPHPCIVYTLVQRIHLRQPCRYRITLRKTCVSGLLPLLSLCNAHNELFNFAIGPLWTMPGACFSEVVKHVPNKHVILFRVFAYPHFHFHETAHWKPRCNHKNATVYEVGKIIPPQHLQNNCHYEECYDVPNLLPIFGLLSRFGQVLHFITHESQF